MMATATDIAMDRTIEVPRGTYTLRYSPRLVRTGADFYDTIMSAVRMTDPEMLASGLYLRPPTAGEEEAVYRKVSHGATELRDVDELRDYFNNNDECWYAWGHTLTGLRIPEKYVGRECRIGEKVPVQVIVTDIVPFISQIADPQFTRESWRDIVNDVNIVKGEVAVPYCRGHVVREMHPIFGIFTEVEQTTEHETPYALHGWLRENLVVPEDPISGHYDVAVVRGCGWRHGGGEWCLCVLADYGRSGAGSGVGFRPVVRGVCSGE